RHTRFSRDWSSDVCSSDLARWRRADRLAAAQQGWRATAGRLARASGEPAGRPRTGAALRHTLPPAGAYASGRQAGIATGTGDALVAIFRRCGIIPRLSCGDRLAPRETGGDA